MIAELSRSARREDRISDGTKGITNSDGRCRGDNSWPRGAFPSPDHGLWRAMMWTMSGAACAQRPSTVTRSGMDGCGDG
jgi:hypothetical protein